MDRTICVRCGRMTVVVGSAHAGGEVAAAFVPSQIRLFHQSEGVALTSTFQACLSCGHAWSSLVPAALRQFILSCGNELACQHVDEIEGGIMRGLPDTAIAREIATKVAELDHLARSNKPNEVVRRFRELTGEIWDTAIANTRNWRDLKREEKLERFGWIEKQEVPHDDLAEPLI